MNNIDSNHYGDSFSSEEFVDLRKYFSILWSYKFPIVTVGLIAGILAAGFMWLQPKQYQATSTISFASGRANIVQIREIVETGNENRDYLQTQAEVIRSRQLASRVVERLQLTKASFDAPPNAITSLFELNGPTKPASELDSDAAMQQADQAAQESSETVPVSDARTSELTPEEVVSANSAPTSALLVNMLIKNLSVELVRGTQLITISVVTHSSELSAEIANTLAEEYLASQLEQKRDVASEATDWLGERLDVLRTNLEESEQTLLAFQRAENLVDVDGVRGLAAQELNEVTTQLLVAKRQLQQVSTSYQLVRRRGDDTEALASLPQIQEQPTILALRQQVSDIRRQISDLQLRYGAKHPRMIAAVNELDSANNALADEITGIVSVIVGQYEAAQANVNALEAELQRVKDDFQELSRKEIQFEELKRQVEINRELYDTFLTRASETSQGTGFDKGNARITDPAVPPLEPLDNKFNLIVFAVVIGSVLLSSVFVLIYEMVQDSIRNPDDVELVLKQKMFGLIPLHKQNNTESNFSARSYFDETYFQYAESIKTLRTSLVLSHLDTPAKIIALTSSVPSEGKTTVSTSLAFALAQNERVLLIDADLRRPSVGKTFGFATKVPGLTNLIAGTHKATECVHRDDASGLDVMPSGPIPPDAQQLLNSLRFSNTVKLLSKQYDRIVIDTAPVNAVSDALMISRISDATLFVVKSGSTRRKVILRGIERLTQVGINIDGIILNQVDVNSRFARSEEFYGYYGGQYGYGQSTDDRSESLAAPRSVKLETV
ncbi:polysaccharide biosynthesis tyrosine autokinase [Microbulbifer sp. YPW1]|uniref:GumC family protein n=1 Tax=Microbulbifer sp. YPW1 TaxID=2745199 RepID=UPI00159A2BAF|nr:polysaccharide biosynthesis tyrosine autokinase [Microbulbifer sp. YPW1]QKX16581.1 polysaccharide biosynthesis tyrosine autokinase [Microbulbifer sp. YPW1]